jgi:pyruvate,orthophosphate dikinase
MWSSSEGDWVSLNGTSGKVFNGQVPVLPAQPEKNKWYKTLMTWADATRQINVRTNCETPVDAAQAVAFGAEGIGLCPHRAHVLRARAHHPHA